MNTSTNLNQSTSIVKDEAKVTRQRARLERRRMRIMWQKIPSPPPPHRPLPLHLLRHIRSLTSDELLVYAKKEMENISSVLNDPDPDLYAPLFRKVLLRDPLDDNVIPIVEELQRRLPPVIAISQDQGEDEEQQGAKDDVESEFPFEFRALEVALEGICSFLDARTRELETAAYPALDELTSKISSRNLDRVRKLKSAMTRMTSRVQKVRDELEQLLDDDDDMADLYLSRKMAGAASPLSGFGNPIWFPASPTINSKISRTSRASLAASHVENDVDELEMLLEAYFMQIEGTLNKLTTLREYIDDTEDYINIQLDNHRNQLIQLELFLSSGTVCVSIYSLVAAVFGMNIPYTWKEGHGYMFKWVVILTGILCGSIFLSIMTYARHKGLVGS